jgi:hypothetical protein
LSAGNNRRPLKSSFKVTADVVGAGAGVGDGEGVGDGAGALVVGVGVVVGAAGVPLLQAATARLQTRLQTANWRLNCALRTVDCGLFKSQ